MAITIGLYFAGIDFSPHSQPASLKLPEFFRPQQQPTRPQMKNWLESGGIVRGISCECFFGTEMVQVPAQLPQ